MKKTLTKVLASLLAVLMLVGVLPFASAAATDASAEELPAKLDGYNRYYFYQPEEWINKYTDSVGIYWWEGTDACSSWPGHVAHETSVEGVYYYDVPKDVTFIIWNNGIDGGTDDFADIYTAAYQTKNIGSEYYDSGESANYPEGTPNFDEMIYVIDQSKTEVNDFSGKHTFAGEWFYYYGSGEYGFTPEKGDEYFSGRTYKGDPKPDNGSSEPDNGSSEPDTGEDITTPKPVDDTRIQVGGDIYLAHTDDYVTYTTTLTTPDSIEDVQAHVKYSSSILQLVEANTPNLSFAVVNTDEKGYVYFNASDIHTGYDFTDSEILIELKFRVKSDGRGSVETIIEEMTEFYGPSYVTNGQVVHQGVYWTDSLDAEVVGVVDWATINCDGTEYIADLNDTVTYSSYLSTPNKIENIQANLTYDSDVLELVDISYPNLSDVVQNRSTGVVYFNASDIDYGYDFTHNDCLAVAEFRVINTGEADIVLEIEEMVEFYGDDYVTGSQIVHKDVYWTEYLDAEIVDDDITVINCGGTEYTADLYDGITYTSYLKTPDRIDGIQGYLEYDSSILQIMDLRFPNMEYVISNPTNDTIYFNCSDISDGMDFSDGAVLIEVDFRVIGSGKTDLELVIEEMAEFFGDDYVTGSQIVHDGVYWTETIENNGFVSEPSSSIPEEKATVICDNRSYTFEQGDVFTYTATLKTPDVIENIQAYVTYDSSVLELKYTSDINRLPNLYYPIINDNNYDFVYYNASDVVSGMDFTKGEVLVRLTFEVVGGGTAYIDNVIENMAEFFGEDYFDQCEQLRSDIYQAAFIEDGEYSAPEFSYDDDLKITCDNETYSANIGDTIAYNSDVIAPYRAEDVQAYIVYDSSKLRVVGKTAIIPEWIAPIINTTEPGAIYFNAVETYYLGPDYSYMTDLFYVEFEVIGEGETEIEMVIEEMTEYNGPSYYTDSEIAHDSVYCKETLYVYRHEEIIPEDSNGTNNCVPDETDYFDPEVPQDPTEAPTIDDSEATADEVVTDAVEVTTAAAETEPTEAPTIAPEKPVTDPTEVVTTAAPTTVAPTAPTEEPTEEPTTAEPTTVAPTDPTEEPTTVVVTEVPATTAVVTEPAEQTEPTETVPTTVATEPAETTVVTEATIATEATEALKEMVDEKTQISVKTDTDAELKVTEITSNKEIQNINFILVGEKVGKMFDITLNKDGVEVQPDGTVSVRIPADNELSKVYRVEENGTLTDMKAMYSDGFLEFVTEHFSLYVVAVPDTTETEPTDPEPTVPEEVGVLGDINGDEIVNIKDATSIQKFVAKLVEFDETQQTLADVNSDSKVNVKDATAIQKHLAKIDTGLPIGGKI